jgi:Secretion system C-terminal sorting domain
MPARKFFICLCAGIFFAGNLYCQVQRLVLFEEFSSEDCPACDSVNPYVHKLTGLLANKVVALSYQSYIPTPGPLYYQDQADVQKRLQYYGVNSSPWGQEDGALWDSTVLSSSGNNPVSWCTYPGNLALDSAYLDSAYAVASPFNITVINNFTGSTDSFYASIIITGADSFRASAPGKLMLRVAMAEDLQFTLPPGTNGETLFQHVVRHMYPDANGTPLADSWQPGQTETFNFSGSVPSNIVDKTKVFLVAFIQDDGNRHVQQAGQSKPFTFLVDAAVQNLAGNFIHCTSYFTPVFTLSNKGSSTLTDCAFQISDNGAVVSNQTWTGNLFSGDSTIVTLSAVALTESLHTITIAAQNPNGTTDGNTGNNTAGINLGVTLNTPLTTPVMQGFETLAGDTGWLTESVEHLANGWSRQNVGDNSNYSYQMDFWDVPGTYVSSLYAPPFSLAGFTAGYLFFDHAYARENFGNNEYSNDSLYIEISSDCGNTWQSIYSNGGATMATAPQDSLSPFSPSPSQWAHDSANLSGAAGNAEVLLRFKAVSGNGNQLYIDNINIRGFAPEGVESLKNVNSFQLFPNPADAILNVSLQPNSCKTTGYNIEDATGRVVLTGRVAVKDNGQPAFSIGTSNLTSGLYLLTFTCEGENKSQLFCVSH